MNRKNIKSKGTTMIETIVSIMILTIIITIFYKLTVQSNAQMQRRIITEEVNRVLFCIIQEIKYNYTLEEVKEIASGDGLKLKYYEDILKDLTKIKLNEMSSGEDIKITFKEITDEELTIKLLVNINVKELNVSEERTFDKSKWMELIYEE